MKNILLVLIIFVITGCMTSTPYQPMGFKGGYENTQLDKNVFEVTFSGNGLTSRQRVRDFAMLRSAELTIQNGYKYFISINENTEVDPKSRTVFLMS